jgi:hypothetical protein
LKSKHPELARNKLKYRLVLDDSELRSALAELTKLLENIRDLPHSARDFILGLLHSPSKAACIYPGPAVGTDTVCFLKPSDSFLDLLTALRTGDYHRIGVSGHEQTLQGAAH